MIPRVRLTLRCWRIAPHIAPYRCAYPHVRHSATIPSRSTQITNSKDNNFYRYRRLKEDFILVQASTDSTKLSSQIQEQLSASSRCTLVTNSLMAVRRCFDTITALPTTAQIVFKLRYDKGRQRDHLLFQLQQDFHANSHAETAQGCNVFRVKGTRYKELSVALATEVKMKKVVVARVTRTIPGLFCLANAIIGASSQYRRWTGYTLQGTMKSVDQPGMYVDSDPEDTLRLLEVVLSQAAGKRSRSLSELRAFRDVVPGERNYSLESGDFHDCFLTISKSEHASIPSTAADRYQKLLSVENTWVREDTESGFQYILRLSPKSDDPDVIPTWILTKRSLMEIAEAKSVRGSLSGEKLLALSDRKASIDGGHFPGVAIYGPRALSSRIVEDSRGSSVIWHGQQVCNLSFAGHQLAWRAVSAVAEADSVLANENATLWIEPLGIRGDERNDLTLSLRVFQLVHPGGVLHDVVPVERHYNPTSFAFYQTAQGIQKLITCDEIPFKLSENYPAKCVQVTASTPADIFTVVDALSVIAQRLSCRVLARPVLLHPSKPAGSTACQLFIHAWPSPI